MDGILIIKKEKGCTSHDIVAKVKRICHTKVGHTGTLDPMATGVLPLLLGEGTKLSNYLIDHDKIYEAVLQLGSKTETADGEGKVIEEKPVDVSKLTQGNVIEVLQSLIGKQKQRPPIYSAIKIKGKKLYEYARSGQDVEIPEREIEIYQMKLNKVNLEEKTISFEVYCSKGTYIRTLCETIAEKLHTVGYMKELNRIQVGKFKIEQAITVQELEKQIEDSTFLEQHLITIEKFFEENREVILNEKQLQLFLNGVLLTYIQPDGIYKIKMKNGNFIGTGIIKDNLLKREIVLKEKINTFHKM